MSGRLIIIPDLVFTDPDAPTLPTYDVMESDGSLLLWDATHPTNPLPTGSVPAHNTMMPNIVAPIAASAMGSTEADTRPRLEYAQLDGGRGAIERSAKGGIHVIITQDESRILDGSMMQAFIGYSAAFEAWQYTNPTNDIYASAWVRVTRPMRTGTIGGTYTGGSTDVMELNTGGGNQRFRIGGTNPGGSGLLGYRNSDTTSAAPVFINVASSTWPTAPGAANHVADAALFAGTAGSQNYITPSGSNSNRGRWPSLIFYRFYVEDLTVSGRTYEEVDALDHKLFTYEVLTPGGRYYGDTFTDPATIP